MVADQARDTPWWRPAVHASPRRAWMNDPNGLVRHGGRYHLFFQHHPDGLVWGPMSWGHASSTDLLRWTEHPVAIPATPQEWVFSGCAVHATYEHADVRVAEGAGEVGGAGGVGGAAGGPGGGQADVLAAVYTAVDPASGIQTQALATSVDGGSTWRRHPGNPLLDKGSTEFRDPKVFRFDGSWVMVLVMSVDHVVELYSSPDLVTWTPTGSVGPFPPPAGAPDGATLLWEMPDLVPVPVVDAAGRPTGQRRWVLLLSVNPGGPGGGSGQAYAVGDFDGRTFVPEPLPGNAFGPFSWVDHGPDVYAATTFADDPGEAQVGIDGRPVAIGWMSNWAYADRVPTSPWRGAATLARTLALQTVDGALRLVQEPVLPAVASSGGEDAAQGARTPGGPVPAEGTVAPDAAHVRVEVAVPVGGCAGVAVLASRDGAQRTEVRVEGGAVPRVVLDRTRAGAPVVHPDFPAAFPADLPGVRPGSDGAVRTVLDVVVDRSSVEVFAAGGLVSLTALVFPDPGSHHVLPLVRGGGSVVALSVRDLTSG